MRRIFFFLVLLLLAACSEKDTRPREEIILQEAKSAAGQSYQHLLAGRYDQFLDGRVGADSLPRSYREQLATACKQFISQQREAHGGISSFTVSNARIDSTQHLVEVFLILSYGDQTQEEIVVPMVEKDGKWKMK